MFVAAQHGEEVPLPRSWELPGGKYIALMKRQGQHRAPRSLAAFIEVRTASRQQDATFLGRGQGDQKGTRSMRIMHLTPRFA